MATETKCALMASRSANNEPYLSPRAVGLALPDITGLTLLHSFFGIFVTNVAEFVLSVFYYYFANFAR